MRRSVPLLVALLLTIPAGFALPGLHDDAGSGRDAGGAPAAAVPVEPGVVYEASINAETGDTQDWYVFHAQEGDRVVIRATGTVVCLEVPGGYVDPGWSGGCTIVVLGPLREMPVRSFTLDRTGPWHLRFHDPGGNGGVAYRFSFGLNGPAPSPVPGDEDGAGLAPLPRPTVAHPEGPQAVVAVIDSGINPYHALFRAPSLTRHPAEWLPDYPSTATALDLSLDAATLGDALERDAALWNSLERSRYDPATDTFDAHLYTFPGTRIVGAASFGDPTSVTRDPGTVPVLDELGHGTMVAGLAAGADLRHPDGDVLIVMVETTPAASQDAIRWAARQPWIDALSVSIGALANLPATYGPLGDRTGVEWATYEAAQAGKPVFVASGNGASGRTWGPDHCVTHTSPYTGPSWVTPIGAAEPESGNPTWWHCLPVEAVGRTGVLSATAFSSANATWATGTSAAAPNVAAHFAHLLLDARRAGVDATADEVLRHLLHAARPADTSIGGGRDPGTPVTAPLDQGYGLVDEAALERARATLLDGADPEPRPVLEAWFTADDAVRDTLWGPGAAMDGTFGACHEVDC